MFDEAMNEKRTGHDPAPCSSKELAVREARVGLRCARVSQKRRKFLRASGLLVSGVVIGDSTGSAKSTAVKEPAVIGYPNRKGVTIERVTYPARNMGITIVANLFKPAGFDAKRQHAAVVVTHPFGGVKEQTSGLYAQHLAEQVSSRWLTTPPTRAKSGGEPRLMEVPAQRLDDISCAIDFLVKDPQVDPERIGSLGICAGGSYVLCNARTELRVKAVAGVSTFDVDEARPKVWGRSPMSTE